MKQIYFILLLYVFTGIPSLFAQQGKQVSAVSERVYISVTKEAKQPPYLEIINYTFSDANENNKIDVGETVKISFDLVNSGKGVGNGLRLVVKDNNEISGLTFYPPEYLREIKPEESIHVEIPIEGNLSLPDGLVSLQIVVTEPNGFGTNPLGVEIETQAFRPPLVKMVDYQVSSQSGNKIEKRRPFDVEVLVQNIGQGIAENVEVTVNFPGNISCLSANLSQIIGELQPGEQKLISYLFAATAAYNENTIPFEFRISEKYNRSVKTDRLN